MDKLLIALDVDTGRNALNLADSLRDLAGGFKIGSRLFTNEGPTLVRTLVERGDRVFLDLKYHDIPSVVGSALRAASTLGGWMATCFAFQWIHDRQRYRDTARYLWSATDVAMVTICLNMMDDPIATLLMAYALLIVVAGLFMRVQLVWFVTAICVLSLLLLLQTRPDEVEQPLPVA